MQQTGSKELIRDINQMLVLESIIEEKVISRASLAKKLGLTKATISAIVLELINKKFVIEVGSEDTVKGRKPINLMLNADEFNVISVNLDADGVTAAISNLTGSKCRIENFIMDISPLCIEKNLENVIDAMIKCVSAKVESVVGITIGIHGVVHDNKVLFTPYYDIGKSDLRQKLINHYNIPVFLENEANLSALAEMAFCHRHDNMAILSVHAGIGIGMIVGGELYSGYSGYAGEFGHTTIEVDGRSCPCGNKGCLEQYVSERAIIKEYRTKTGNEKADFNDLKEAYIRRETDAVECMNIFVKYMAVAVRNVINMLNPRLILINSEFTVHFPELADMIKEKLTPDLQKICMLEPAGIKEHNILRGGAAKAVMEYLQVSHLDLRQYL